MSDMKCPICQTVLEKALMNDKIRGCPKCRNMGNIELWQSLINERQHATDCQDLFIDAIAQKLEIETELECIKKQLETAVSALKYIQDGNLGFSPAMDFAEKALEQITALTKGGDNE